MIRSSRTVIISEEVCFSQWFSYRHSKRVFIHDWDIFYVQAHTQSNAALAPDTPREKKMKKRKEHIAPSNDKIFVLTGERRYKKIERNGRHSCKL